MPPFESPQEAPLSAQEQKLWRSVVEKTALRSLCAMEALYLSEQDQEARKNAPLRNERYQQWLAWMEKIDADPKALFRQHGFVDEGTLLENINVFSRCMEALEEVRATQRLSEATKKKLGIELREGEFLVFVDYVIPPMEELRRRFPGDVSPVFESGILFEPIEACKGVSCEPRYIKCECVHLDRDASSDEVLAEMERRGLRPCLLEELIAFDRAYPEEQRKFLILALGSGARVYGRRSVAYLWGGNRGGRSLHLFSEGDDWFDDYRFLAVREIS